MQVLIPTLGCHPALSLTLESFLLTSPSAQVTLVCGRSKEREHTVYLRSLVERFPTVNFIWLNKNYGFPGNVNRGMREIDTDGGVLISNDDVVVLSPGWADRVGGQDKAVGAVGPVSNYVLSHQCYKLGGHGLHKVPVLSWFWIYVTGAAWRDVGPLDEDYGLGLSDDLDWCHRATRAGYDLLLDKEILVWHWGSSTFRALEQDGGEAYGVMDRRNRQLLLKKHPELANDGADRSLTFAEWDANR